MLFYQNSEFNNNVVNTTRITSKAGATNAQMTPRVKVNQQLAENTQQLVRLTQNEKCHLWLGTRFWVTHLVVT